MPTLSDDEPLPRGDGRRKPNASPASHKPGTPNGTIVVDVDEDAELVDSRPSSTGRSRDRESKFGGSGGNGNAGSSNGGNGRRGAESKESKNGGGNDRDRDRVRQQDQGDRSGTPPRSPAQIEGKVRGGDDRSDRRERRRNARGGDYKSLDSSIGPSASPQPNGGNGHLRDFDDSETPQGDDSSRPGSQEDGSESPRTQGSRDGNGSVGGRRATRTLVQKRQRDAAATERESERERGETEDEIHLEPRDAPSTPGGSRGGGQVVGDMELNDFENFRAYVRELVLEKGFTNKREIMVDCVDFVGRKLKAHESDFLTAFLKKHNNKAWSGNNNNNNNATAAAVKPDNKGSGGGGGDSDSDDDEFYMIPSLKSEYMRRPGSRESTTTTSAGSSSSRGKSSSKPSESKTGKDFSESRTGADDGEDAGSGSGSGSSSSSNNHGSGGGGSGGSSSNGTGSGSNNHKDNQGSSDNKQMDAARRSRPENMAELVECAGANRHIRREFLTRPLPQKLGELQAYVERVDNDRYLFFVDDEHDGDPAYPHGRTLLLEAVRRKVFNKPLTFTLNDFGWGSPNEPEAKTPEEEEASRAAEKVAATLDAAKEAAAARLAAASGRDHVEYDEVCFPYVAKLRGDFGKANFSLYDNGGNPRDLKGTHANERPRCELLSIGFKRQVTVGRSPKSIELLIPAMDEDDPEDMTAAAAGSAPHDAEPLVCRPMTKTDGLRRWRDELPECVGMFVNKNPEYNKELKKYLLSFGGRITKASVKNFQLIRELSPSGQTASEISLQFGRRQAENIFALDFRYPLTPVQAFGIAVSISLN